MIATSCSWCRNIFDKVGSSVSLAGADEWLLWIVAEWGSVHS
jgi:hypothetical protein